MSKLEKIIKPIEGFQYSVNIAYDIYDDKKIQSYIPSNSSLQIIEDILSSTENKSTDRARILTGAYGKGKSHLILCVLALLAGRDKKLFSTLVSKAEEVNPTLAKNINAYLESDKKLLPVIVNANSMDIKSTLLQSLSVALSQANLTEIMPSTFFDVAIEKITTWREKFNSTYIAFEKKAGQSGESFINELKDYNQSSYDLFVKIYPQLTSGSEFNPIAGSDVIGVYESVIEEIKKHGYNGIYIVYDEFGKFLEGSVDKSSAMDIKIVQDLAEKCNRSGAKQLHIMLISHKSIENYIGKLSKVKVDAWKAVSNRFKSISINNDEIEIYDMVATVLGRDQVKFEKHTKDNKTYFDKLKQTVESDHAFSDIRKMMGDRVALSCYPLHPYTLLLLPRVSELVAQNERTIFTFLSSTERFSIPYFIRTENMDFPVVEPDYIYDYFEKLFKGEPFGSEIKKQWQITTAALAKLKEFDNELAEKIVKTIALIYCVNDFEIIPPSWDIITEIYSVQYQYAEIEAAKEVLKASHLLIELLYRPYVRITEGSGHDVLGMIKQETFALENKVSAKDVLDSINTTKYFYPIQYNDENEIIRYFDFKFIYTEDLFNIDKTGFSLNTSADGVVYAILLTSENDRERALTQISEIKNPRAVFILPKNLETIEHVSTEYQAIVNLISKYTNKEVHLIDELGFILEDRASLLTSYIDNSYLRFEKRYSEIYYKGENIDIRRRAQLSHLLSDIVGAVYSQTPKIVNEMINKNVISGAIKNARQKVVAGLLAGNYQKDLGFLGNGPETSILRSTLIIPGIYANTEDAHIITDGLQNEFGRVLAVINAFVLRSAKHKISFGEIYETLTSPAYSFGLKKGVIPIYIAVILAKHKEHIVVTKKEKEYALSAGLLNDIELNPDEYYIKLEEWDDGKNSYILILESIFSQYINASDLTNGAFAYITKAMRRWYLQMTKYETTTKFYCNADGKILSLDKSVIKFRTLLSNPEINAHEFLFDKLLKCFGVDSFDSAVVKIRDAYTQLNTSYRNQQKRIIKVIRSVFGAKNNESVTSCIANFYDDLKQSTKEHSFNGKIAVFLNIAKHPKNDETALVEDIARALYNLRMGDFTDDIMQSFETEIQRVKEQILEYNNQEQVDSLNVGSYKIIFTDANGEEIVRQFDRADRTESGEYFYNAVTDNIAEFAESITSDEKRQILFEILKELV